ncbi:VWA domain-containing protein [Vibrio fluvialis]|uniref:vWA domain-containing protein n=1 Tax=Vibrio fluvialis TaxID=676 RepID=UPI001C9D412F|nr:VWA domain-containing protein [Vibrio fluvialis]MBY7994291.1 VWA domain-containing protein [Vibrio fluvialis]MBY8102724.1 VWA domain-containing protein [Vibrio fluvialis]MCG6402817.1 VWA domain-containing protein [Vibrio fluvialis]
MSNWSMAWQQLSQFHFLRPLWLLALVPLLVILYLRWKREESAQQLSFFPEHLRQALTLRQGGWSRQLPLKMLVVVVSIAVIICAGPTWQREASPFGEDSASLMVLLDSSESMLQKDVAPDRLTRGKQKISDLTQARHGGKTGLIVFAGSAHVAMPLTSDNQVLKPYLAAINPEVMPVEGKATQRALSLLKQQIPPYVGNTLLLISDGVSDAAIEAFTRYFSDNPYQLLILATGNPQVESKAPLDMNSLQRLAQITGGDVITLTIDDSDIQTLESKTERFRMLSNESTMPWQDEGYWLILPLAAITLLWFRRGWLVKWGLIFALLTPSMTPTNAYAAMTAAVANTEQQNEEVTLWDKSYQWWLNLWLTPNQQGEWWFNRGEFVKAAVAYQSPINKGIAYYYAGEFTLAQAVFMQSDSNLGRYYAASALARQREYIAARQLLRSLSTKEEIEPSLKADAEHNLAVIDGLIEEINQASASQANSVGDQETSIELPDDQPQTAEGADEQTTQDKMIRDKLSADQILGDPQLAQVWLKRVEASPQRFLQAKFQLQNLQRSETKEGANR